MRRILVNVNPKAATSSILIPQPHQLFASSLALGLLSGAMWHSGTAASARLSDPEQRLIAVALLFTLGWLFAVAGSLRICGAMVAKLPFTSIVKALAAFGAPIVVAVFAGAHL